VAALDLLIFLEHLSKVFHGERNLFLVGINGDDLDGHQVPWVNNVKRISHKGAAELR
jgi:hypothetical protein